MSVGAMGLLAGARVGVSLFEGLSSIRAAGRAAAAEARAIVLAESMERMQVRQQGEYEAYLRQSEFARARGTQRAAAAASGAMGGRSLALLDAVSQASFMRQEAQAGFSERMALRASEVRERGQMQAGSARIRGARDQAFGSFVGTAIQTGVSLWDGIQAERTRP